jgi:serine/threonine protein kinase/tetratricopeptide (TPR) repeat protein
MQASRDPSTPGPDWEGTDRYRVIRRVGEGGMGVVYEALDRERRRNVALKTLLRFDPNSVYLFKQEFRALADVHHRNLVHLHELVQSADGPLFFTMELVAGLDFLQHVLGERGPRRGRTPEGSQPGTGSNRVTRKMRVAGDHQPGPPAASLGDQPMPANPERLRPALRQLVHGLRALHAAGKLHRDVKPSNVLVTPEGRVVLLDFGIAMELARGADESDGAIIGTPLYVSPERAAGKVPTPASDWYALGVMLYEALAGRPPFEGSSMDLLMGKARQEVIAPSTWARGIPPDLEALCVALLQREPSQRPEGAEILRRLGAGAPVRPAARLDRTPQANLPLLVGREDQLEALRSALDVVSSGQAVTVRVNGSAGMGKSTLVQHFLDEVAAGGEALALSGRAYERESVPYKAVDSLVDSLARRLIRLEETEGPFAPPKHADALARLFPVLKRVPSFARIPEQPVDDPLRVRHEAFGALRELLGSLAQRRPLILYVDDVQWGDIDSAALLHEVMRPPEAPPILLVMTYRAEEASTSPFLTEMNERWPGAADLRDVAVGPLDQADVQLLALARMSGSPGEDAEHLARAVAREAKGSPFLVEELVRSNSARTAAADSTLALLTLAEVVRDRLARLPDAARRLAQVVAVSGRPLTLALLAHACGEPRGMDDHVELLRGERLVRAGFRDGNEVIEPSHDRIRETIVEQLRADVLRAHHAALARAFEATAGGDVEALAIHLLGSGEAERGARYAERAAEQAAKQLAFDQAARLYRLALDTLPRTPDDARPLRAALAAALERSGRGAEAAKVYLEAASGAPQLQRIDLERSASGQLLLAGRTDDGVEVLHRVLAAVGMKAPRTALGAVLSLLFHRFLLALRGLHFEERGPEEVAPEDRVRVDALSAVAQGYSVVDVVLGACMQARLFRLALDVGDRWQVMRAASIQFAHLASQGGRIGKAERAAYAIAMRLSQKLGDPTAEAYFLTCRGLAMFHRGRWKEARETLYSRAAQTSNDTRALNRTFGVYSLFFLGRVREQARRATQLLADAERRGDSYTVVNVRAAPLVDACLAADDPDAARRHIRIALATWTQNGFHVQHWKAMLWEAQIELYEGDGPRAYARLERDRRAFKRSLLGHAQFVREMTRFVRGCAAVAASLDAPESTRRARLDEAQAIAKHLERQGMIWIAPLASLVHAAVANAEGDAATAATALRKAAERADAADMALYACSARHQLGCLLGGDEGERIRREAEAAMSAEGIQAPARIAKLMVPGRWGPASSLTLVPSP